jgi:hypothetical protein
VVVMFALLRRNPDLTTEQFVEHWKERHGPLIAGTPELARHIHRYEQHVRHRPDGLSGNDDLDGVAVQWYRTIDDFAAFISEPAYAELIAPDERRFLDVGRIEFIITEEPHVVIDGARPDASNGTAPA